MNFLARVKRGIGLKDGRSPKSPHLYNQSQSEELNFFRAVLFNHILLRLLLQVPLTINFSTVRKLRWYNVISDSVEAKTKAKLP